MNMDRKCLGKSSHYFLRYNGPVARGKVMGPPKSKGFFRLGPLLF
uniref:Uncharacterized protein n=1 Tax=Anguilla anguilla TaxID=7936 RepID=A0A0E9Q0B8_ANGAN